MLDESRRPLELYDNPHQTQLEAPIPVVKRLADAFKTRNRRKKECRSLTIISIQSGQ